MAPNYSASNLFTVKDVVAVITGGGSGLGANIAEALDTNGAKAVYILGRRASALQRTASAGPNGVIKCIECDVTSKDSLASAASQIEKEVGYIDVLFANSGITGPGTDGILTRDPPASLDELQATLWKPELEDFTNTFRVNVSGAWYTAIAFLKLLDAGNKKDVVKQKSQIIVTSSIAGFTRVPFAGPSYSYSKAAVTHMVKQLVTMLGPYQIRANVIAPGFYPSEMTQDMAMMNPGEGKNPRVEGSLDSKLVPLMRTGTEEEIAGLALWMVSPAGGYINGAVQLTDGGRISVVPGTY